MYHKYLTHESFFAFLYKTDQDLARQDKNKKCAFCGGVIHVANYMRKPRGPDGLPGHFSLCFSFCCSRDGCRSRVKPKTIRFLGRFVYWSVYVILISAMLNARSFELNKLSKEFDIDIKTLKRWRQWWKDFFPTTKFWKKLKGNFLENVERFPLDLLILIEKKLSKKEESIKKFLHLLEEFKE